MQNIQEEFPQYINAVIPSKPRIDSNLFGGVNGYLDPILMDDGIWDKYLPTAEYQSSLYFDTYACVSESATNNLEILCRYLMEQNFFDVDDIKWATKEGYIVNGEFNFSARAIAKLSGTKPGIGNSGEAVGNAIAYYGLIPESRWAFDLREVDPKINNIDQYYKDIPQELLDLGKEWTRRFTIRYSWIWSYDFKEAVKYAPLQVYVNAWYNKDGVYYNPNKNTNHAVVYKSPINKQIFDTYNPVEKKLAEDYYYYPSGLKFTITKNIIKTPMKLINNYRYVCVEGQSKQYGFVKNGKMIVGDRDEILNLWIDENDAKIEGKSKSVTLAMWESVQPKYNLKLQTL